MKSGAKRGPFLILIIAILGWTLDSIHTQHQFSRLAPKDRLQSLWNRDFQALQDSKAVPPGWYQLKEVAYSGGDPTAKAWIDEGLRSPHPVSTNGTYRMEVLVLSFEEDNQVGAIIQYNLVNLKTSNMEWERGRTYILSGAPSEWQEWVAQLRHQFQALSKRAKSPPPPPSKK